MDIHHVLSQEPLVKVTPWSKTPTHAYEPVECDMYAVIDGTHRIKKALSLGVEFPVLLLTAEESYAHLVWAPASVWAGEGMLVAWERQGPTRIEGMTT